MSKHQRKTPGSRGQRAARRIAATNKIRSRTFTRGNENPSPIETCGEIFATGMMLELVRDAADDEIKLISSGGGNVSISSRFDVNGKSVRSSDAGWRSAESLCIAEQHRRLLFDSGPF